MGRILKKKTSEEKAKQKDKQKKRTPDSVDQVDEKKVVKNNFTAASKAAEKANREPGLITKCRNFLKEVNVELKKVVWPTKNQAIASTIVVIILVTIVSSFLGLFDVLLKGAISMVLQ